ncbi:uncharacterized protein LOC119588100, partial [Penaeus monodon]|uniref:uncharacterized protein LOC119588100 n=1 Tax=Penaeus monodon TaxID=6687 RepID=UPI0018A75B63
MKPRNIADHGSLAMRRQSVLVCGRTPGGTLDASQNSVFNLKDGAPATGSAVSFIPARPKKGRHLFLRSTVSFGRLTICNLGDASRNLCLCGFACVYGRVCL